MARAGNNHRGGRPKGSKAPQTLEKEAILKAFRERVLRSADMLFNAQATLAKGQTYLYKIEKELIIGPKGGKSYHRKKPELVTSQWEIESYLESLDEDGNPINEDNDSGASYYFLTTKDPNNMAIDSLWDRTFGKSTQAIDVTSKGEQINTTSPESIALAKKYEEEIKKGLR